MGESQLTAKKRFCAACGSSEGIERGEKNGFTLISCRSCGTLYAYGATPAESAHDYDSYYNQENLAVPDFINRRLDEIVGDFSPYKQNGRLLDIGFGAGSLMEAAARAGWTTLGVEVSPPAIEHVGRLGFEVFCGELQEAHYPDRYFDVVTASEILEHVDAPRALVSEIARILRPGGLFWATTPHGKGVSAKALGLKWSVISPPEHLQLFSVRSMKRVLLEAGFSKVRIATQGVNPSELLSTLRRRKEGADPPPESCNRVESGYRLNEFMTQSPTRRILKRAINGLLNASSLGDSLKIWAER
jgi:SAM-dependent methyltransferase